MPIQIVTPPSVEPLTLAEVEAHLRLDTTSYELAPNAMSAPALAGAGTGNVDNGAHAYLATFVTATGETQAGVSSTPVTVIDNTTNGKVSLSGIPLGASSVTARNLYRTKAGGATYYYLATIADNATAAYTDNVADASLGVGAPTANTTGDPLLLLLISAARQHAENICRRAFCTQQWLYALDRFPMPGMNISSANWYGPQWGTMPGPLSVTRVDGTTGFEIYLPFGSLQTVDSIKYYDSVTQLLTTLDPSQYIVDNISEPARVTPAYGVTWPATLNIVNAVLVTFTCGYGAAVDVPQGIKNWMLVRLGTLHENREEVALLLRGKIEPLPYVDGLLDAFRLIKY